MPSTHGHSYWSSLGKSNPFLCSSLFESDTGDFVGNSGGCLCNNTLLSLEAGKSGGIPLAANGGGISRDSGNGGGIALAAKGSSLSSKSSEENAEIRFSSLSKDFFLSSSSSTLLTSALTRA